MCRKTCLFGAPVQADRATNQWPDKYRPRPHPQRVLIVESDRAARAALQSLVEEYGLQAHSAPFGAIVGRQTLRCRPDLILVNANMPDESGLLIACKLRLMGVSQPIWLYTDDACSYRNINQERLGLDKLIAYGGVFSGLLQKLRPQLELFLSEGANFLSNLTVDARLRSLTLLG